MSNILLDRFQVETRRSQQQTKSTQRHVHHLGTQIASSRQ